jgi:NCS1 family nucleobase:cation symporter-1
MMPWKLVADPSGYIFTWLIAYSALLGAIGGILIADYFWIRRTRLDLAGLYQPQSAYWYVSGVNPLALAAFLVGVAPCVPGFLATIHVAAAPELFVSLYHYAWFLSFGLAFATYGLLTIAFSHKTGSQRTVSAA